MSQELITVVTCTVGDSSGRLEHLCAELRRFTDLPFDQVISDDGTIDQHLIDKQRIICDRHGIHWTQNPGPVWGISYNFNHALSHVYTPWAFLIEDGLRPSQGWLEVAYDFIDKIGSKSWYTSHDLHGHKVGMAGFASLQDWTLAMGGAVPHIKTMDMFAGVPVAYDRFYDPWNDGLWCWKRLLPGIVRRCNGEEATGFTNDVAMMAKVVLEGIESLKAEHPTEKEQCWQKFRTDSHWPTYRKASCGWYPGAFMLLNMEAFKAVGRMRDGCTFFEGHLGTRMGMNGYLSLVVETPPFLHQPSQGFRMSYMAREPRDHRDTTAIFKEDFGYDHMDAPNVRANAVVSLDTQREINEQLSKVELCLPRGWERWV